MLARRMKKEKKQREKKRAAQRDDYREELALEEAILAIHHGADLSSADEGGFIDDFEHAPGIGLDHRGRGVEDIDLGHGGRRVEAWEVDGQSVWAEEGAHAAEDAERHEHAYAANWGFWQQSGVPVPHPVPQQWEAPWHAGWGGGLQESAGVGSDIRPLPGKASGSDIRALPGKASGSAETRVPVHYGRDPAHAAEKPVPNGAFPVAGSGESASAACVHCERGPVPHQAWPGPGNVYPPWYPVWGSHGSWPLPEAGPCGSTGTGTEAVPGPDCGALGADVDHDESGGRCGSRSPSGGDPLESQGLGADEEFGRSSPQETTQGSPGDQRLPRGQARVPGTEAEKEIREEYVRVPISLVRRYYELEYEAWVRRYKEWQEMYYSYAYCWPGYQQAWPGVQAQPPTSAAARAP